MISVKSSLWINFLAALACVCTPTGRALGETAIIVSVPEQRLVIFEEGKKVADFPVSTSKFGVGDRPRSFATPLGWLEVASKVGAGAPQGAVFKRRRFTGEVLRPNARGRDPIVTRILHLRGLQAANARAFDRGIYIHGTPEEVKIGRPASYGCVRMCSRDVVRVFDAAPVGTRINIVNTTVNRALGRSISHPIAHGNHRFASNW
jgi:lipoprotein-anchoring transpeptidase ErfK/SrfK